MKEYEAIFSLINRRSQSQEKFLLFNLTSSGVIFSIVLKDIFQDYSILLIIPFVSFILYLLWIDHAITIAALEKYIKSKDETQSGWYRYRENLNMLGIFRLKKYLYNFGVSLGFIGPSIAAVVVYLLKRLDNIARVFLIIDILLTVIQVLLLIVWRKYTKDLYG